MIIYFSAVNTWAKYEVVWNAGAKHYLFSFYELTAMPSSRKVFDNIIQTDAKIMIDSGAHTLQKGKKVVDYDKFFYEYLEFMKKYEDRVEMYVELDIENIVGLTKVEKWAQILSQTLKTPPIIVWHRERGYDYWEYMCKAFPIVGFSGFVTTPNGGPEVPNKYLPLFLKVARDTNTKVHGFGFTRFKNPFFKYFYSTDSTSWIGARYNRTVDGKEFKSDIDWRLKDEHNVKYILHEQERINKISIKEVKANEN